jgi:hypothetical protein
MVFCYVSSSLKIQQTHESIADAYDQIHIRYKEIFHIFALPRLSCISDASVNNKKLGTPITTQSPLCMEKVNNEDESAKRGADQVKTIVAGCMSLIAF